MNTQRVEGHTQLPWNHLADNHAGVSSGGWHEIRGNNGKAIAHLVSPFASSGGNDAETNANAKLIVHACNNIERLEKVNEALTEAAWNRIEAGHDEHCPACFMGHQKCTCGHDDLVLAWKLAKEPA